MHARTHARARLPRITHNVHTYFPLLLLCGIAATKARGDPERISELIEELETLADAHPEDEDLHVQLDRLLPHP